MEIAAWQRVFIDVVGESEACSKERNYLSACNAGEDMLLLIVTWSSLIQQQIYQLIFEFWSTWLISVLS